MQPFGKNSCRGWTGCGARSKETKLQKPLLSTSALWIGNVREIRKAVHTMRSLNTMPFVRGKFPVGSLSGECVEDHFKSFGEILEYNVQDQGDTTEVMVRFKYALAVRKATRKRTMTLEGVEVRISRDDTEMWVLVLLPLNADRSWQICFLSLCSRSVEEDEEKDAREFKESQELYAIRLDNFRRAFKFDEFAIRPGGSSCLLLGIVKPSIYLYSTINTFDFTF